MRNKKSANAEIGAREDARREKTVQNKPSTDGFQKMDEAIGGGSIAVFAKIKSPPFAAQSELIELRIVLPSKWSSQLLDRIEKCIDDFGDENGLGKAKTIDEGNVR